jgi:hypothetical protein
MTKRSWGRIEIDGYEMAGVITWSFDPVRRTSLRGGGYKETPIPCYIEYEGIGATGIPLRTYQDMTDATIRAVLDNGITLNAEHMFCTSGRGDSANIYFRFEGVEVSEK